MAWPCSVFRIVRSADLVFLLFLLFPYQRVFLFLQEGRLGLVVFPGGLWLGIDGQTRPTPVFGHAARACGPLANASAWTAESR